MQKTNIFRSRQKSVLYQTAWLISLLITITIVILSSVSYFMMKAYTLNRVQSVLSSVVASKEDVIEAQLNDDRQRAAIFSLRPDVQALFADPNPGFVLTQLLSDIRSEQVPLRRLAAYDQVGQTIAETTQSADECLGQISQTVLKPLVTTQGWQGYLICAPVYNSNREQLGTIAMEYPLQNIASQLKDIKVASLAAELQIARLVNDSVQLINSQTDLGLPHLLELGSLKEQTEYRSPLALALQRKESVEQTQDYRGNEVLAAYRYLPTLGWALVVAVPTAEVFANVNRLLFVLYSIGLLLIGLASFGSVLLAMRLTAPLRSVANRVRTLGPDHWAYRRLIKTGDEVEQLDNAVFDMAKRLKGVYTDMEAEIKARTKELSAQYERDRTILEAVEYGIMLTDPKGIVIQANTSAGKIIQKKQSELVGAKAADLLKFCNRQRTLVGAKHPINRCLKERKTVHFAASRSVCLLQDNGIQMPVLMMASPVINKGKIEGCVIVFRDITAEVQVDQLKSEFISLASHQLRTPLSTMQWYIELLADGKGLDETEKEYAAELKLATDRMIDLVNALLTAAQLEGEAIEPHLSRADLTKLVKGVSHEMRWLAKDAGISSSVEVPTRSAFAKTDPALLHVVLQNLFSNAVKYTEKGGHVSVNMKILKNDAQITVADQGIGIPEKDQKMIFTKLYRASNVLNKDTDGTGLGLYISRMVIEVLGGKITFKSKEGKGSKFTITLPLSKRKN